MEYLHGGDIYRNNVKYDFSVNVNPLGMPEGAYEALIKGIKNSCVYPDPYCERLRGAIEKNKGIKSEYIIMGNGAAELIYGMCQGLKIKKALIPVPTFTEYERAVKSAGGVCEFYGLKEGEDFKIKNDITDHIGPHIDMVFICNPNNPTGNVVNKELLIRIAEKCEKNNVYLCIDECFLPFCENEKNISMLNEIEKYENIIVLRAFTKIYAMAGLRLGYCVTKNSNTRNKIRNVIQPWNVSSLAQIAGCAVFNDKDHIIKTLSLVNSERDFVINEMKKGLVKKVYNSKANYIFFKDNKELGSKFKEEGILIRDCSDFRNLEKGYYRICIKKHNENRELLNILKKIKEV